MMKTISGMVREGLEPPQNQYAPTKYLTKANVAPPKKKASSTRAVDELT